MRPVLAAAMKKTEDRDHADHDGRHREPSLAEEVAEDAKGGPDCSGGHVVTRAQESEDDAANAGQDTHDAGHRA